MRQYRGSSRRTKGAYGAIALTTLAMTASGCSAAQQAAAPPTSLGNVVASPSTSTTSRAPAPSTSVPTVAAPAPAAKIAVRKPAKPAASATPKAVRPAPVASTQPSAPKPPVVPVKAQPVVVVMQPGATGPDVRSLQARLRQIGWYTGDVSDRYGPVTTTSVRGFQAKRGLEATGTLDQTTYDRLLSMTRRPTADELNNVKPKPKPKPAEATPPKKPNAPTGLVWDEDSRCLTGRVMCISKSTSMLTWVVDGKAQYQFQVRFGSADLPTREGVFPVYRKARTLISNIDQSEMPFSMFFSGGEAVHYSANFARLGYDGNSHGCVNVRDWNGISRLYSEVNLGDQVVVHW